MEFHAYIFDFGHDLLDEVSVVFLLVDLSWSEFDGEYHFLENVVVEVVFGCDFLPLIKHFLQLEVHPEGFGVDLVQSRQEVFAEVLVVFVQ